MYFSDKESDVRARQRNILKVLKSLNPKIWISQIHKFLFDKANRWRFSALSILKNPWWVKTRSSLATAAPETVWVTLGLVGVKITVSASNKFYPESCLVSQQVLTVGFEKENCTDKKCGCHAQSWYFSLALI